MVGQTPLFEKSGLRFEGLDAFQQNVLTTVDTKGFHVEECYFGADTVSEMLKTALDFEKSVLNSDKHLSFPSDGVERYLEADNEIGLSPFSVNTLTK